MAEYSTIIPALYRDAVTWGMQSVQSFRTSEEKKAEEKKADETKPGDDDATPGEGDELF